MEVEKELLGWLWWEHKEKEYVGPDQTQWWIEINISKPDDCISTVIHYPFFLEIALKDIGQNRS